MRRYSDFFPCGLMLAAIVYVYVRLWLRARAEATDRTEVAPPPAEAAPASEPDIPPTPAWCAECAYHDAPGTTLDKHGLCSRCGSNAVAVVESESVDEEAARDAKRQAAKNRLRRTLRTGEPA